MHEFRYVNGQLYCEGLAVAGLVKKHGTPLYIYSQGTIQSHYRKLDTALGALDHLICYAVKANSNLAVLKILANCGAGFDIVSEGELRRVIAAGGNPGKCVFAGVGKTEREIEFALREGIYAFNAESEPELERIDKVARRLGLKAPVAVRVNPNVDAGTHAKITTGTYENKFGVAFEQVEGVYQRAALRRNLWLRGVQMHIGSQLTKTAPFKQAVEKVAPLAAKLAGRHGIEFFSIGGGLGIVYQPALASGGQDWWRSPAARGILTPDSYAAAVAPALSELRLKILVEPGRFIVGNAGILVTRIEYIKRTGRKTFIIVDAAMNDLIRPAFYDSYHEIVPLRKKGGKLTPCDVVGPICESGDYFCKDRPLPRLQAGEHLAILSAGAYGSVMGSNYNSRPATPEVLVCGRQAFVVRRREPLERLWELESLPPE